MITIAMLEAKKIAAHTAQNLTKRFTMVVNQCAEAVRILTERGEEYVLCLRLNGMEKRWREHMVMLIHEAALIVIVHIHIAIGFFVDVATVCLLATGFEIQRLDAFVDDLIYEFAFVVEEMLNAVMFGGNETFRPIDFDSLVSPAQDGFEVKIIDDTFVTQFGVV